MANKKLPLLLAVKGDGSGLNSDALKIKALVPKKDKPLTFAAMKKFVETSMNSMQ